MSLTVTINKTGKVAISHLSQAALTQRAANVGRPNASKAVALTVPILNIDQRNLSYKQRLNGAQIEFRFDTGPLILSLRHEMFFLNSLTSCQQGVWETHERDHVADNESLMASLEPEIRRDPVVKPVLVVPQWHPRSQFARVQNDVEVAIGDIFRRLTAAAAQARDKIHVYQSVQRSILGTCPGPYYHEVEKGETLSSIAKFYYGNIRLWQAIYNANKSVIGANPDLIVPGQSLEIPKSPKLK